MVDFNPREKSSAKKFIPKGAPSVDASGADTSGADTVASTNLEPLFRLLS